MFGADVGLYAIVEVGVLGKGDCIPRCLAVESWLDFSKNRLTGGDPLFHHLLDVCRRGVTHSLEPFIVGNFNIGISIVSSKAEVNL